MENTNYKKTTTACFIGYIVQSIITSFPPLLYLYFQSNHNIDIQKITLLVGLNFLIQLIVDLVASKFAGRINYRICLVTAHLLCAAGLIMMTVLPFILPFNLGLTISVIIYASGGGLLEVLISPVVESCPTKNKAGIMSFLHSFYCWGVVATVLLSTLFFVLFGIKNWKVLTCLLAVLPLINAVLFLKVPLYKIDNETNIKPNYKKLFVQKSFWIMFTLMICAGACEQALSQWASTIAESSLNVSKTVGDLFGVCSFAAMMGISRLIYAKLSNKITLKHAMIFCCVLCAISLLMISLCRTSIIGLIGFALCGFSIGIFWPGTFSLATKNIKSGGTTMFALLALAGDIGCTSGPSLVGHVSEFFNKGLQSGILLIIIFPVLMLIALFFLKSKDKSKSLQLR